MRVRTIAFIAAAATLPAAALADPVPGVTVNYDYNFRPGERTTTGEDGTAVLPVPAAGVYEIMLTEPLNYDSELFVSAGGSDATLTLPKGTVVGTRKIVFRLAEGEDITVRVEGTPPAPEGE